MDNRGQRAKGGVGKGSGSKGANKERGSRGSDRRGIM